MRARPGSLDATLTPTVVVVEPVFRGVAVALVTLFDESLAVDEKATAAHAARLIDLGVSAVLVAGSTGEASALTLAERASLVRAVRAEVDVPLIVGTGASGAREAARLTRDAIDAGADAVLALSPAGIPDPRPYYDDIAAAAHTTPVLAYHFPARSSPGIAVERLPGLPVAGMKDSSGDAERLALELATWDKPVYPGSSALALLAGAYGCPGVILAMANVEPERCLAAFGGSVDAQLSLAAPQIEAKRSFPGGIKALTAARFATSTAARLR